MKPRDELGYWVSTGRSYDGLLRFESVKNWIGAYSSNTRDAYLRCLGYVLDESGLSPDELLALEDGASRLAVVKVSGKFRQEDKASQARMVLTVLRAFFDANGRTLKLQRTDRVRRVRKKIAFEHIPDKSEVYRMIDSAGRLRDKALIACAFQSGVRVGCLIRWRVGMVRDGLFPEIRYPLALKITRREDPKISSYGLGYYITFIHKEACQALRRYLEERGEKEGKLDDSDHIFKPIRRSYGGRMAERKVNGIVKKAAQSIALDPSTVWTHLLRKSFRKVLYKSNVDNDLAEALMGHRLPGSKENYFDSKDTETLAKIYDSCEWSRTPRGLTKQEVTTEVVRALMGKLSDADLAGVAEGLGITPQEIRSMITRLRESGGEEEDGALIRNERDRGNGKNQISHESKLILEEELCSHMDEGWEMVKELTSGKILVRRQSPA